MTARTIPLGRAVAVAVGGGLAIAALAVGGLSLSGHDKGSVATGADAATGTTTTRTVTVVGQGVVTGTPDLVTLSIGVEVRSSKATDALAGSATKATALIATLKKAGVSDADVQTQNVSLGTDRNQDGSVRGYIASNTVVAKLHDLAKAGATIDQAANAVGDGITVNGIDLSIDATGPLLSQGRVQAMADAKAQATELAKAGGANIGKVVSINEQTSYSPKPEAYAAGAARASDSITPIEAGQSSVSVQVTVVYELTD